MLYNIFAPQDGTTYGALACSACNKNVAFELEPQADLRPGKAHESTYWHLQSLRTWSEKKQMETPHCDTTL
jgi:hypothetical protein